LLAGSGIGDLEMMGTTNTGERDHGWEVLIESTPTCGTHREQAVVTGEQPRG
jgi:hypothetical protein